MIRFNVILLYRKSDTLLCHGEDDIYMDFPPLSTVFLVNVLAGSVSLSKGSERGAEPCEWGFWLDWKSGLVTDSQSESHDWRLGSGVGGLEGGGLAWL